jgi:hypothetical protein
MSFILQYFEQVSQVYGQYTIDQIFIKRTPAALNARNYSELHERDPLRMFDKGSKPGVPIKDFVLSTKSVDKRPQLTRQAHWERSTRFQLINYKMSWEPLPIGATCKDILERYPNHLWYEFLDTFDQHGIVPGQMVDLMPEEVKSAICQYASRSSNKTAKAIIIDRIQWRRKNRRDWYGEAVDDEFVAGGVKIRQAGIRAEKVAMSLLQSRTDKINLEKGLQRIA